MMMMMMMMMMTRGVVTVLVGIMYTTPRQTKKLWNHWIDGVEQQTDAVDEFHIGYLYATYS